MPRQRDTTRAVLRRRLVKLDQLAVTTATTASLAAYDVREAVMTRLGLAPDCEHDDPRYGALLDDPEYGAALDVASRLGRIAKSIHAELAAFGTQTAGGS